MNNEFKRDLIGHLPVIFALVFGFMLGSFLTLQATEAYLNANYECFPLGVQK